MTGKTFTGADFISAINKIAEAPRDLIAVDVPEWGEGAQIFLDPLITVTDQRNMSVGLKDGDMSGAMVKFALFRSLDKDGNPLFLDPATGLPNPQAEAALKTKASAQILQRIVTAVGDEGDTQAEKNA
jgi:hypothetical protein